MLVAEGAQTALNDPYRIDGTNAVCVSIGYPNYRLFYRFRNRSPGEEWVVIAIEASALWELRCAFCPQNAASKSMSEISIDERSTIEAFRAMYSDSEDNMRGRLRIDDADPTDPQAEVLMLDGVPLRYILGVGVENEHVKADVERMHPTCSVACIPELFQPRPDFAYWQNNVE
jgi:hypothetical protein